MIAGLLWCAQTDLAAWRPGLFGLAWLGSFLVSVHGWRRSPQGHLRWTGQVWTWSSGPSLVCREVVVHLDLQFVLLLSLRTEAGRRLWLWPERRADLARWRDLRRAIFARTPREKAPDADGLQTPE
jgi:hypothetical protein